MKYTVLRLLITLCLILIACAATPTTLIASMKEKEIIPDVIDEAPTEILEVTYLSGVKAELGNELTPTSVRDIPTLQWRADKNAFYTVTLVDPDAPSREDPKSREFKHWLVVNVPGNDMSKGETLAAYVGSGPPKGTGLHRYIFLVYKQNGKITADEKKVANNSIEGRPKFSIRNFAKKYNLGKPIAGNFYQAEYDDYVPFVDKQLGFYHILSRFMVKVGSS